jgi:hypothetical protein
MMRMKPRYYRLVCGCNNTGLRPANRYIAVPDPPNVFAFLEHDSEDEHDHEPHLHHEVAHLRGAKTDIPWVPGTIFDCPPLPGQMSPGAASMSPSSSSGAGSFHSDVSMALPRETADEHGNKTDRSTSPEPGRMDTTERKSEDKLEKEVEDNVDRNEADGLAETDTSVPTGEAATKLASQMLAAQHRQTLSSSFGSPQAARRTLQSRTHSHRRRHTSSHAPSPPPQAEPIHAEHHYPSYHYPELAYAQQQIVASPPLPLPVMHMHQQPLQSIAHPIAQQTFPPYSPMMHHHQQQQPVTPHSQHAPHAHHHQPTGYSALSLKISSRPFPSESNETIRPLYRRFEHLNHRVLLHMQDELSELEAQLQALDDADCARRAYGPLSGGLSGSGPSGSGPSREGATGRPESRRQTATFAARGDELSWRREELLRVVVWKVQVYNKALRELDKLVKELPPADDSDVDAYREFLKEGNHVVEQETRFLDEVGDLVVVGGTARGGEQRGGKGRTALGGAGERHVHFASEDQDLSQRMRSRDGRVGPPPPPSPYVLAFAPAAATLLPIMVFPFITSFAGRVIVAGLLGGAVAVIACLCVGLESLPAPHRDSGTANMALVCAGVWGVMMFVLCGWL